MSFFRKIKSIPASYPAFKVVELTPNRAGFIELKSGDELYDLENNSSHIIDSVISYAIANNEDPIKAFENAIENEHKRSFIFSTCSVISSTHNTRPDKISITSGLKVKFEGKYFELESTWNRNFDLKEIT